MTQSFSFLKKKALPLVNVPTFHSDPCFDIRVRGIEREDEKYSVRIENEVR